jgi:hypothetical protein
MAKTLNQIIFFSLHQNQYNIFFSNIGNQNIFLEKKHNPPPRKLNGPSLSYMSDPVYVLFCCKTGTLGRTLMTKVHC